jgi:hypothetical protein
MCAHYCLLWVEWVVGRAHTPAHEVPIDAPKDRFDFTKKKVVDLPLFPSPTLPPHPLKHMPPPTPPSQRVDTISTCECTAMDEGCVKVVRNRQKKPTTNPK